MYVPLTWLQAPKRALGLGLGELGELKIFLNNTDDYHIPKKERALC